AFADHDKGRHPDLAQPIRGLMLLTREDVAQVVLEVRTVGPERVVEPRNAIRMCRRELRREERVADVLPHVTLVPELDHLLRGMDRDPARHGPVVAELTGS